MHHNCEALSLEQHFHANGTWLLLLLLIVRKRSVLLGFDFCAFIMFLEGEAALLEIGRSHQRAYFVFGASEGPSNGSVLRGGTVLVLVSAVRYAAKLELLEVDTAGGA